MTSKKISRDHLQNLVYNFERDEKVNFYLMLYTLLNIIFTDFIYIRFGLFLIFFLIIFLVALIFIVSYCITNPLSLHLNRKKNKMMIRNLRGYLITGKKKKDNEFEDALDKLKLTERQYKISQLSNFSYLLLFISIEVFILLLFDKIQLLINPLNYNMVMVGISIFILLSFNLLLLLIQTLRYMIFKGIRQVREFLDKIIIKELTKIEKKIKKIMNLKIKEFKFKGKRLLRLLQRWSDLYLGSYFVGLREQLLISDYKNLTYSIGNEIYYYNLFNDLKFKIEESQFLHSVTKDKSKKIEYYEIFSNMIELNVKRLNTSIQSKILEKNEKRNKIRMYQTWIAIISITLSIIFSFSRLPSLIGL